MNKNHLELISEIKLEKPTIIMHGECYHIEYSSAATGKPIQDRVVTESPILDMKFSKIDDASGPLEFIPDSKMIRIYIEKGFILADENSLKSFDSQVNEFIDAYKSKDKKFDFWITIEIPRFNDNYLTFKVYGLNKCMFHPLTFTLFALFGFSAFYMCWFNSVAEEQQFVIIKKIHA